MKKQILVTNILVVVLIGGIGLFQMVTALKGTSTPTEQAIMNANTTLGVPGVAPISGPSNPDTVVITLSEIEQYVATHHMIHNLSKASQSVKQVLCTTDAAAIHILGEDPGLSLSSPVCIAQVRGSFVFPGPLGKTTPLAHTGFFVFDGRTGNVIMAGTMADGAAL